MKELKPTLWRTCRVLASATRLDLLRMLDAEKPPRTVLDLASQSGLPDSSASECLRALNARGLILSQRKGKHVFYSAEANPNVADAAEILLALKNAFARKMSDEEIIDHCTAYTHERRIALVNALRSRPGTAEELSLRIGASPQAVRRHLGKLERRGLIDRRDDLYFLVIPDNSFARALFLAALNQQEAT